MKYLLISSILALFSLNLWAMPQIKSYTTEFCEDGYEFNWRAHSCDLADIPDIKGPSVCKKYDGKWDETKGCIINKEKRKCAKGTTLNDSGFCAEDSSIKTSHGTVCKMAMDYEKSYILVNRKLHTTCTAVTECTNSGWNNGVDSRTYSCSAGKDGKCPVFISCKEESLEAERQRQFSIQPKKIKSNMPQIKSQPTKVFGE